MHYIQIIRYALYTDWLYTYANYTDCLYYISMHYKQTNAPRIQTRKQTATHTQWPIPFISPNLKGSHFSHVANSVQHSASWKANGISVTQRHHFFFRTWNFITLFTKAYQTSLCQINDPHHNPTHFNSITHRHLDFLGSLLPSDFLIWTYLDPTPRNNLYSQ